MSYVPDETVLGNPGFFGFIGKAVKAVVGVAGKVISGVVGGGQVQVAPPQITVQAPAPTISTGKLPEWVLPVAIGGGALVLVLLMSRGRR